MASGSRIVVAGVWVCSLFLPAATLAAAGDAPMVIVADTRRLTGLMAWWAELYNESLLYFTLLTIILVVFVGVFFGLVADRLMYGLGIDLNSRDLPGK